MGASTAVKGMVLLPLVAAAGGRERPHGFVALALVVHLETVMDTCESWGASGVASPDVWLGATGATNNSPRPIATRSQLLGWFGARSRARLAIVASLALAWTVLGCRDELSVIRAEARALGDKLVVDVGRERITYRVHQPGVVVRATYTDSTLVVVVHRPDGTNESKAVYREPVWWELVRAIGEDDKAAAEAGP